MSAEGTGNPAIPRVAALDTSLDRGWVTGAIAALEADTHRTSDTHLLRFPFPAEWGIDLYLKDESTHPTGSLKHRLARSLFLYALANGWLTPRTPVVEASSGSTAVSEAYFARLLGLPFTAVVPEGTSGAKLQLIESYGGRCHVVPRGTDLAAEARLLARETSGHFMDQFTYAERATDWRGNNNIAESMLNQLEREAHPVPSWVVVGAGTGGTSSTIGRFLRYRRMPTRLCVVDPEGSAFYPGWLNRNRSAVADGSRIEGIGRPIVEQSFVFEVVDRMLQVPDAASILAMRYASEALGRRVGGSTGTNLWGALQLAQEMRDSGETGSIVSLICDGGDRYADTYYSDEWTTENGLDLEPYRAQLAALRR